MNNLSQKDAIVALSRSRRGKRSSFLYYGWDLPKWKQIEAEEVEMEIINGTLYW